MIPGELVKPFKSNFPSRLAESRAELLEKLLIELGTENSGFTLENVMTVNNLNHNKYVWCDNYVTYKYECTNVFYLGVRRTNFV